MADERPGGFNVHVFVAAFGVPSGILLGLEFGWIGLVLGLVGPSLLGFLLILMGGGDWYPLPAILILLGSLGYPAYKDYRARDAIVADLAPVESQVLGAIDAHVARAKRFPARLEDLGALPGAAKRVTLDPGARTVTVPLAAPGFEGMRVVYKAGAEREWICSAPDVQDKYLPSNCRRK